MLSFSVNPNTIEVIKNSALPDLRPTTDTGRQWWSEYFFKALEKKTFEDNNNLDAYGYTCDRNTMYNQSKKETSLLSAEEIKEGARGVAQVVASYVDTHIESILNSDELKTFISDFLMFQEELLVEEGVNLWVVMNNARNEHPASVDKLRDLVSRYDLSYTVQGVLSNPECLTQLEAEFNVNLFC